MQLHPWHHFDLTGRRFATVALDTTRDSPGAAHRIELRWASARERLSALGVPARTVELIGERIGVMDATAATLCRDNNMPIRVFKLTTPGNIKRVVFGESIGTTVGE